MRYPIDVYEKPDKSLLFWIGKFVKYKINTLSHAKTTNKQEISSAISYLNKHADELTINDISDVVKRLRRVGGFDGVKTFYLPVKSLYRHLKDNPVIGMRGFDNDYLVDFLTSTTSTYSDATKVNYRNGINNFFSFVSKNNENEEGTGNGYIYHLDLSRWQGLTGKSGKKQFSYLTEDEVRHFLHNLDTSPLLKKDRTTLFYNLFVRLVLYTGMRISEALNIHRKNLNYETYQEIQYVSFRILGKGNYDRTVITELGYLEPYLSRWIREEPVCDNGMLFCSVRSHILNANPSSVSTMIKKLLREAGIKKDKEGTHLLRHTYATILYSKTKDLALVQDALGHEDPKTTRVYTQVDKDRALLASRVFGAIEKKST